MEQRTPPTGPEHAPCIDPAFVAELDRVIQECSLPESARQAARYLHHHLHASQPQPADRPRVRGEVLAEVTLEVAQIVQPADPETGPRIRLNENLEPIVREIRTCLEQMDVRLEQQQEIVGADAAVRVIKHRPDEDELQALLQAVNLSCMHPVFFQNVE